jgi:hypothetical protein
LFTYTASIVGDFYLCERWIDRAHYPKILRAGVFPRVCDGFLCYAQQFGLDRGG